LEEPVNAANHFLVVDQVAPVGRGDTTLNTFDKASLPLQHAADRLLNYLRGVLAFAGSELLELRLGIGSEVNFHACQFSMDSRLRGNDGGWLRERRGKIARVVTKLYCMSSPPARIWQPIAPCLPPLPATFSSNACPFVRTQQDLVDAQNGVRARWRP
jgi:hypothetical protein